MNINIYKHELRFNLRSAIIWFCAMTGIALMYGMFYPLLKENVEDFVKMISEMNPAMKAVFGLGAKTFMTPEGYFTFVFTFSSLCAAIHAMNLGVGMLSKEERERTADFLMTKPVTRQSIYFSKLACVFTIFLVNDVLFSVLTLGGFKAISGETLIIKQFILIDISLLLIQLMMFAIGFILSVSFKKIRSVSPISLGLVFLFYAISAFAVNSPDDKLRYITPFQYFKGDYIIANNGFESSYLIVACALVLVSCCLTYVLYKKRNIHAV